MKAYVLAGGASRRMGRDKTRVDLGGSPMLECVLRALARTPTVTFIAVVAREDPGRADARFVQDLRNEQGALSGLEAALADACPDRYALILACDYPLMTSGTLAALVERAREHDRPVMLQCSGQLHPLAAVWPTDALPRLRHQIDSGSWRVLDLAETVGLEVLSMDEAGASPEEVENVNSPEDLSRVRRIDEQRKIQSSR